MCRNWLSRTTSQPTLTLVDRVEICLSEDVNNQLIRFVLTGDVSVAGDDFIFDLMDSKPNRVTDNNFYITWSFIEFDQLLLNVTETSGIVQVPVNRKGNLKQVPLVFTFSSNGVKYYLTNCLTLQGLRNIMQFKTWVHIYIPQILKSKPKIVHYIFDTVWTFLPYIFVSTVWCPVELFHWPLLLSL